MYAFVNLTKYSFCDYSQYFIDIFIFLQIPIKSIYLVY